MSRVLLIALMGFGLACAPPSARTPWPTDPLYDMPEPPPESATDAWGQYRFTDATVYRGSRPSRMGDHVMIRVDHVVDAAGTANTTANRTSEASANISALFGLESQIPALTPNLQPTASIGATDATTFSGDGATDRTGRLRTTVTAKVLEVRNNGFLVVGARQQVKINNEVEILWLYGVVDPRLVDSDNAIDGNRVADLRMEYSGVGVVAGKQNPGWMVRILDAARPF